MILTQDTFYEFIGKDNLRSFNNYEDLCAASREGRYFGSLCSMPELNSSIVWFSKSHEKKNKDKK